MVKALKAATQAGPSFCSMIVSRSTRWRKEPLRYMIGTPAPTHLPSVRRRSMVKRVLREAAISFSQSTASRGAEITGRRMKTA